MMPRDYTHGLYLCRLRTREWQSWSRHRCQRAAVIWHISGTCDMLVFRCGTRVGGIKGVAHVFFHPRISHQCNCPLSTVPACHLVLLLWSAGLLMSHLKEDVAESTAAYSQDSLDVCFWAPGNCLGWRSLYRWRELKKCQDSTNELSWKNIY